jgi:hypothetical protein
MYLMVCTDFQKHYGGFSFIDDFLEEIVERQLRIFYITQFNSFLSVDFHFFVYTFPLYIKKQR